MKAITYTEYGTPDVLRIEDVEKPAPKDNEVLVKIHAVSLNAYDWHFLSADIFMMRLMGVGMFKPKNTRLGADLSGRVEAVGKNVTRFKPGDEVYGDAARCGNGAFAEYKCMTENLLALKPVKLSFEEAAAVPMAGITALQGLRDEGKIKAGQKVLIQGASGGVGTYAVQIAKWFGAEVTAVCSSRNIEQARKLGADHVIDYTKENFTESGKRYDLIFAANGHHPLSAYKRALAPGGIYVMAGGTAKQIFSAMLLGPLMSIFGSKKMGGVTANTTPEDLTLMKELIESGKITPVIDKRFSFDQAADAFRYLGEGHARGKVVITIAA